MVVAFIDESDSAGQADYEQLHRVAVQHRTKITRLPGSRAVGLAMEFELIEVVQALLARGQRAPPHHTVTMITLGRRRSPTEAEAHDEANDASAQTASWPCPPPTPRFRFPASR